MKNKTLLIEIEIKTDKKLLDSHIVEFKSFKSNILSLSAISRELKNNSTIS